MDTWSSPEHWILIHGDLDGLPSPIRLLPAASKEPQQMVPDSTTSAANSSEEVSNGHWHQPVPPCTDTLCVFALKLWAKCHLEISGPSEHKTRNVLWSALTLDEFSTRNQLSSAWQFPASTGAIAMQWAKVYKQTCSNDWRRFELHF